MITIDLETKSYADLRKVGAWAYSEDPTTEIICVCWGIDDQPIQSWWPDKFKHNAMPLDLERAIVSGQEVEAHNVAFERSIWHNILLPRYGWLMPEDEQWRDLMAVACYLALPASLDRLSRALGFGPKDSAGTRLITKYSKLHLKTAKKDIPSDDFTRFVAYCVDDVQREQAVGDELGCLPEPELAVFHLDQRINMRGIYLDQEGIDAATAIVEQRNEELTQKFRKLTGVNPTQRDKVLAWCKSQGVELENLQAEYLEELLEESDFSSGPVRQALEIRLEISKASTKKLDAMSRQRGKDGRARFQSRYHGAVTGRWTGAGFQPLNLHRGFDDVAPEQLVRDILYRDPAWLDQLYGDAMDAVAKASRHWIRASDGNRIMVGDYSAIEAVILACLAGEQWKVDAFARGEKIYERTAEMIHRLPEGTVTKERYPQERHDGKTCELAFGYQGALGAWLKFDNSGRHTDEDIIGFCKAWRAAHPRIVAFWHGLEEAAIEAVHSRGDLCRYNDIAFQTQDEWLTMILPNGKRLWYRDPELRVTMPQWHKPAIHADCAAGTCDCRPSPRVTYMAQKTGQWKRVYTYGGKLAENATQATCREILVQAMHRLEDAGYPIILSVYDEIVCEVPENQGSLDEFQKLMSQSPGEWATGWPISVHAWEGRRYKK